MADSVQDMVFVVGTGRCGSTLLSEILKRHPAVLSLSEFFVHLQPWAFRRDRLDGKEFWQLLTRPRPKEAFMLRHGLVIPEFLSGVNPARYGHEEGMPPILLTTLPHLASDYDRLYNEIHEHVQQNGEVSLAEQYGSLFGWLRSRFGRQVVVERSGGSLPFVGELRKLFPAARYIHMVRDSIPCAMSMSRHHAFRLSVIGSRLRRYLGYDPVVEGDLQPEADVPEELRPLRPSSFRRASYEEYQVPLHEFGRIWSDMLYLGAQSLGDLPSGRILRITYEGLLEDPRRTLAIISDFLSLQEFSPEWQRWAERHVRRPSSPAGWPLEGDVEELRRICAPGHALLASGLV
jgi:putative sulfotransferase